MVYGGITSGNQTVDAMGMINISGNVIPQVWYSTITRTNGKPYLLAITLLADIVYWYRPVEVRDEQSGRVIGWKKRFKGNLLQKTYQQYAELYGESKRSIKAALDRLEELKIIKKEFHNVTCENGTELYNLMFIALDAEVLYQFTYPCPGVETTYSSGFSTEKPSDYNAEESNMEPEEQETDSSKMEGTVCPENNEQPFEKACTTPLQNNVSPPTKFCTTPLQNNVPPPTKFCRTNTKNTTENTNREYINLINQGNVLTPEKEDEMDIMTSYAQILKENIGYDALKLDYEYQGVLIDEIVEILVEIVCVKRDYIRIGGADYPHQMVKSRFLKLNGEHIRYVLDCMEKNTREIVNIKAYLVTALFNAPCTINSYYSAKVKHDLYGGITGNF